MTIFLSIVIALLIERVFDQLKTMRGFNWLADYTRWMTEVLHIDRLASWMAIALLFLPLLIVIWILDGLFDHALFGIFELGFNVLIVFACLGPKDLDQQIDFYIDAVETGSDAEKINAAKKIAGDGVVAELAAQATQVSRAIFVEANRRLYAMIFWFLILGPVGAVAYRLFDQFVSQKRIIEGLDAVKAKTRQLIAWIDWLPVHLTLFAYMVSGNFDAGMQSFRKLDKTAADLTEENAEMLRQIGFSSIQVGEIDGNAAAVDCIKKSRGLVLRALIVWVFFAFLFVLLQ